MSTLKIKLEEAKLLTDKLEYRFKKSGHELLEKLQNEVELTEDEVEILLKKLEYRFKKSSHELVEKLKEFTKKEE